MNKVILKNGGKVEVSSMSDVYLQSVVCPRSEAHSATLFVKWKPFYVHFARRLVNCRGLPKYLSIVPQGRFRHQSHLVIAVRAVECTRSKTGNGGVSHEAQIASLIIITSHQSNVLNTFLPIHTIDLFSTKVKVATLGSPTIEQDS
jgi:hypothetical protein